MYTVRVHVLTGSSVRIPYGLRVFFNLLIISTLLGQCVQILQRGVYEKPALILKIACVTKKTGSNSIQILTVTVTVTLISACHCTCMNTACTLPTNIQGIQGG